MKLNHAAALVLVCTLSIPPKSPGGPSYLEFGISTKPACEMRLTELMGSMILATTANGRTAIAPMIRSRPKHRNQIRPLMMLPEAEQGLSQTRPAGRSNLRSTESSSAIVRDRIGRSDLRFARGLAMVVIYSAKV